MKLDYGLIAFDDYILGMQLSAVGKNLPQLCEGGFDEGFFLNRRALGMLTNLYE